jgi:hypothetical protein
MPHAEIAPPPVIASLPFVAPPVEIGQVVLWSYGPSASEPPCPAIVRKVGASSLNVSLVVEGTRDLPQKTGVRHADDPFLKSMPMHDAGCWRLSPRDVALNLLIERYGDVGED